MEKVSQELDDATKNLPNINCICNEDMDPKNVMWHNGNAYIIDLECLNRGNPISHAFQLSLQWAGITTCKLSEENLKAFWNGYLSTAKFKEFNPRDIFGIVFTWIEWLEYNTEKEKIMMNEFNEYVRDCFSEAGDIVIKPMMGGYLVYFNGKLIGDVCGDELYTYWGRNASKNERNPELLFIDARPWVKRKPCLDFNWGIVLKENNKVIGMIDVFNIQNLKMGDIGYRIHPEYWNKGITTEALKEVIRFIFENTEIERLNGNADVRNIASNKVLERCGFIKEGTIRQGKMVSVYCDYNIYGMLREDYAKRNS